MIKKCHNCKHFTYLTHLAPCNECIFDKDGRFIGEHVLHIMPKWEPGFGAEQETKDVSTQSHYTDQGIQPIVLMCKNLNREQFIGFLKGNVLKYILRADKKNGVEDYAKAAVYASWLKEYTSTGKITVPGIGEVKK